MSEFVTRTGIQESRVILKRVSCWLAIWWWWLFVPILTWRSRSFEVTDKRIVIRRGVLSKKERSVRLENILDVALDRSLFARMFGYGDIYVETAGSSGTEFVFKRIAQPEEVRSAIYAAQERRVKENTHKAQAETAAGYLVATGQGRDT